MKKQLLLLGSCILTSIFSFSQNTPVSQSVEQKNAILEELTGIHCTFCPDGHKIAKEISDANPGRVVVVNIHAGGYATPSSGEVDLRTTDGTALNSWMAPSGYPSGAVQRRAVSGSMPVSRGSWSSMVNTVLTESSPVNIALDATIDATNNTVTVTVEIFYTATQNLGTNHYLNVGILQDNIEGTQTGASTNPTAILPNGNYLHQHAFRGFINPGGINGDQFDAAQSGVITKTYTYTLPTKVGNVNLSLPDLKFFAFVGPGKNTATTSELFTAAEVAPVILNIPPGVANLNEIVSSLNVGCNTLANISPVINVYNSGLEITSLSLTASVNGGLAHEYNWTGSIGSYDSELITIDDMPDFVPNTSNNSVLITITEVNGGVGSLGAIYSGLKTIAKSKAATGSIFRVEIFTDAYPEETSWEILNSSNQVVASGGGYAASTEAIQSPDANTKITHEVTLNASDCYSFKLKDSYGDGLAEGTNPAGGFGFKIKQGSLTLYSALSSTYSMSSSGSGNAKYELTEGVLDLTYEAASTASLTDLENVLNMEVYPNPASENVKVRFNALNNDYTISLVDITGRTLISNNYTSLNGSQSIELPLTDISSGNYIVTISSANGVVNQHIVVE